MSKFIRRNNGMPRGKTKNPKNIDISKKGTNKNKELPIEIDIKELSIKKINKGKKSDKRVAFLFFGLHYMKNYHIVNDKGRRSFIYDVDYRKCLNSHKNIFKYYNESDVFLSTNHSDVEKRLLKDYKPIDIYYDDNNSGEIRERTNGANNKIINGLEMIKKSKKDYDNIIITRFDLILDMDFDKCDIQYDKFNITCKIAGGICDNFYIIKPYMIDKFIEIIRNNNKNNGRHWILKHLNKNFETNFILKHKYRSIKNIPFYKLPHKEFIK